jgi:hypothetical protein
VVRVDQVDIHLRPPRLSVLFHVAAPSQSTLDEETLILSVPARLRKAGMEIRMLIDGTDPFAAAKPDARLIKLLLRRAASTRHWSRATASPLLRLLCAREWADPISAGLSAAGPNNARIACAGGNFADHAAAMTVKMRGIPYEGDAHQEIRRAGFWGFFKLGREVVGPEMLGS